MDIHKKIKKWEKNDGPKLMRELGIKTDSIIIDMGCGFGHYSIAIQNILGKNGKVIAIDKDQRILSMFKDRNELSDNIEYFKGKLEDIENSIYEDADFILLYDILHGASPDRFQLFEKLSKIIKPNYIISILPFHLSNFRDREGKKKKYSYNKIINEMNEMGFTLDNKISKGIHFEKYHSPHIMSKGTLNFEDLEVGDILNFILSGN